MIRAGNVGKRASKGAINSNTLPGSWLSLQVGNTFTTYSHHAMYTLQVSPETLLQWRFVREKEILVYA